MCTPQDKHRRRPGGFTLLEMATVVAILAVLAGLLVLKVDGILDNADQQVTQTTLNATRDALTQYRQDMRGFSGDGGFVPPNSSNSAIVLPSTINWLPLTLASLYVDPASTTDTAFTRFNPQTALGWRGPYVQGVSATYTAADSYGVIGDSAPADAWHNPIVLQIPVINNVYYPNYARLISAGPDATIQTPVNQLDPSLVSRGDDIVLFLFQPDIPAAQ